MSVLRNFKKGISKIARSPELIKRANTRRFWRDTLLVLRFGETTDLRSSAWMSEGSTYRRRYKTYSEYVRHQASKLDDPSFRNTLDSVRDEQYSGFLRRFSVCNEIKGKSAVLCLGARLGTEVEVFKQLGFFAVGIDLNPGIGNQHVHFGDFHNLAFKDNTVDVVYTNVLDHAFDINKTMGEIRRVLRPEGVAFFEIVNGSGEGYLPGEWEAVFWDRASDFAKHLSEISGLELVAFRSAEQLGDPYWNQAVLRKHGHGI